ncbi:hypothetical protein K2173_004444 [Erythroxylum novogranatense]|uniref:Glabrous enhancer-binding protein-like C-terminal domain-containing protein n=1 Tax=Erythroxylum novogranatense TaxID=1862640 RepID=A0AAV8T553_9ROSI|nr:hypothetical protein K2173_004444 [Erythroxylum novogranatense]
MEIWGSGKIGGGLEPSSAKPNGKPSKCGTSLDEVKAEPGIDSRKEGEGVEKMEVDVRRSCLELRSSKMFDKSVEFGGMADYVVKRGLDLVDGEKKAKMEEKWRKLHVEEVELFLKRIELMREQAKLMLEAYKARED